MEIKGLTQKDQYSSVYMIVLSQFHFADNPSRIEANIEMRKSQNVQHGALQ